MDTLVEKGFDEDTGEAAPFDVEPDMIVYAEQDKWGIIGDSYQPKAEIWKNGLAWTKTIQKWYNVPWTEVTLANADKILAERAQYQKR